LRFVVWAAVCGVLADVDSVGLSLGIPYEHVLGHRGLMHSLPFALLVSVLVASLAFRDVPIGSGRWWLLVGVFFGVMAVHAGLDAMTDGGLGVAFFAPVDAGRYWLPWRPVPVAPIGLRHLLTPSGARVLKWELLWLWAPAGGVFAAATAVRWLLRRGGA